MDRPTSKKMWTYEDLKKAPHEILIHVLAQLDPQSLVNFCSASKEARRACKPAWKDLFQRDFTSRRICQHPDWEKLYRLAVKEHFSVYEIILPDTDAMYAIGETNISNTTREALKMFDFKKSEIDDAIRMIPEIKDPELEYSFDVKDIKVSIRYSGTIPISDVLHHLSDKGKYIVGFKIELTDDSYNILDADYTLELEKTSDIAKTLLSSYGFSESVIETFEDEYSEEGLGVPIAVQDYEIMITDITFKTSEFAKALPLLCKM